MYKVGWLSNFLLTSLQLPQPAGLGIVGVTRRTWETPADAGKTYKLHAERLPAGIWTHDLLAVRRCYPLRHHTTVSSAAPLKIKEGIHFSPNPCFLL